MKWTNVGTAAALIVVGVAMAFAVAEIALRLLGISYPVLTVADPITGAGHVPNARGRFLQEGRAFVRINSQGLRDHEHSFAKPGGVYRIAVLGDSYAEAFQVEDDEPFWAVMERPLSARIGRPVEAINFAVSGFGTTSELISLRQRAFAYAPDAVLLTVTTGNDVSDNLKALKNVAYFPYFVLRDSTLVLDSSFVRTPEFLARSGQTQRWFTAVAAHSRVVQVVNQVRMTLRARKHAKTLGTMIGDEPGLSSMVYVPPRDSLWREAWKVTEALLDTMRDECRARGIPLFVVTLSNGIQVDPDRARRERFASALGVPDLFYPERRFREIGERSGFDVLNLAPILQQEADSTGVRFHGRRRLAGEGHWNREGHRRAGLLIADWLGARIPTALVAGKPAVSSARRLPDHDQRILAKGPGEPR